MSDRRTTYVIAIANQKGGVGKTTSVISLAGALAKLKKNVLLVDLDIQANLTISFDINPHQVNHSISDVFFNAASLVSVSRETKIPGVDLVPIDKEMNLVERFLPLRPDYKKILLNSLGGQEKKTNGGPAPTPGASQKWRALEYYDFLFLDCPPSLGAVTTNALAASNLLVIPTQAEYYSIYAIQGMLATVEQIHKENNPGLCFRLLITMFDKRNQIHVRLGEKLKKNYPYLLFDTLIGVDTQLRETSLAGLPITHSHARTRSALQYQTVAQEIIELSGGDLSKG